MPKNDKKGGDKSSGKGKGGDKESSAGSKSKGAQSINVRHILVSEARSPSEHLGA
jgi:NIMA-interacting peptidyl-prolyl cis-trans isomerase 4